MLRNGAPIDAEAPDYRELDTVPNERRYTADQPTLESQPLADPPSNPPCSPSSVSMMDNASFSNQVAADVAGTAEAALDEKVSLTHMLDALPLYKVSARQTPSRPSSQTHLCLSHVLGADLKTVTHVFSANSSPSCT